MQTIDSRSTSTVARMMLTRKSQHSQQRKTHVGIVFCALLSSHLTFCPLNIIIKDRVTPFVAYIAADSNCFLVGRTIPNNMGRTVSKIVRSRGISTPSNKSQPPQTASRSLQPGTKVTSAEEIPGIPEPCRRDRQTDRRTDGRTPDCFPLELTSTVKHRHKITSNLSSNLSSFQTF